ncbi:MAG: hypothetical protein J6L69_04960 [Lachnospiraceae bacterium]|nr:hypothetical protein [Lachnospiraceae bacterium]
MEKSSSKKKVIIILAVLIIVAAIVIGYFAISYYLKKEIVLNDYLEISYDGYDGEAMAKYKIDYVGLVEDLTEDFGLSKYDLLEIAYETEKDITGKIDVTEKLKNGDEITFEWDVKDIKSYEKRYDCRIKYESESVEVKGLEESVAYDPFDDLIVTFSGISPNGTVEIDSTKIKYNDYLGFEANVTKNLKNGDVIKVFIDSDYERYGKENGFHIVESEKEYTVEGLDEYITSIDSIPEESLVKMQNQAKDTFTAFAANKWTDKEIIKSFEYIGSYLLVAKDSSQYGVDDNSVYLIYKVTMSNPENEVTYYYYTKFFDLIKYADGEFGVDLTKYKVPDGEDVWGYLTGKAFAVGSYWYVGYQSLDLLFNDCVTKNLEKYTYESSVKEQ